MARQLRQKERKRKPKRRFRHHELKDPTNVWGLPFGHPAAREGRTLFPSTVVDPADAPRVLVSGINHRKLGDRVVKGPWSGMPIFALTLEERATCPLTCFMWYDCYGNNMQLARRHKAGAQLVFALEHELAALQKEHPGGFVVRLHILGDFYSVDYVKCWADWLRRYPALRVFGYTALHPVSPVGKEVARLRDAQWDRFAIRFSSARPHPAGATVISRLPEASRVSEGFVCPAETGNTDCCGTCGLCWSPTMKDDTVVFVKHGRTVKKKEAEAPGG